MHTYLSAYHTYNHSLTPPSPPRQVLVPITQRAGRVVKLVVSGTPDLYLFPEYLEPGSNSQLVYT